MDAGTRALTDGPLSELAWSAGTEAEAHAREVLAGLDALIERCLAPDHQNRPSSSEVLTLLANLAEQGELTPEVRIERLPVTAATEATFWNDLANTYGRIGQHDEQERLARRAVALAPDDPELWANLASALSMGKQPEKAREVYCEAEDRLPARSAADSQKTEQWRARMAILVYNWATTYDEQGLRDSMTRPSRPINAPLSWIDVGSYALAAGYVALADETARTGDISARLINLREADAALTRTLASYPDFPEAVSALQRVRAARKAIDQAIEGQWESPENR